MKHKTARRARPKDLSAREIGPLPWSYLVVIAICGCIVAAGFLLAARQHFVSMDLGMKNSKLRQQLEDLEAEKRRLTLAREIALSPIELTRTAKALGFTSTEETEPTVQAELASARRNESSTGDTVIKTNQKVPATGPVVTKTNYQRPANGPEKAAVSTVRPGDRLTSTISKPTGGNTRVRIVSKPPSR